MKRNYLDELLYMLFVEAGRMGVSLGRGQVLYCVCYELTAMGRIVCSDSGGRFVHLFDEGDVSAAYANKRLLGKVMSGVQRILDLLGEDCFMVAFAVEGEHITDCKNALVEDGVIDGTEDYKDYGNSY